MNVTEPFRRLAQLAAERPALIGLDDSVITYEALDQLLDLVALAATAEGLRPGDAVGLLLYGLAQGRALVIALGLARAGIASAPPDRPGLARRLLPGPDGPDSLARFWDSMAAGQSDIPRAPMHRDPEAVFRIFASSGTTGRARAFAVTHRMMATRVQDHWLAMLPLPPVHVVGGSMGLSWGMTQVLRTLWAGGTLVFSHAEGFHAAAARHTVSSLACSPGVLADILAALPAGAAPLPALRRVEIAGSTLPPGLRRLAEVRLCPSLVNYYGAAEVGGIASAPFAALDGTPGAAGFLHAGVLAEALDEAGQPLPPGREGRLCMRSPGAAIGYLDDPVATAERFRDGWFETGDLGWVEPDGMVVVTGRASEVINAGGTKVAPGVIEAALGAHPEVIEAAAFGAPDEAGLTRIWAAIVAERELDAAELAGFARDRLGQQAPSFVLQLGRLPRNAGGKIDRAALVALAVAARPS